MIELVRIVETPDLYHYRATQNENRAFQLEILLDSIKSTDAFSKWHPLINRSFRYLPPHPHARFRPRFGRNIFYASLIQQTAFYEHAFHFMRERVHLNIESDTGIRTLFKVNADDKKSMHIRQDEACEKIMTKNDYEPSHLFIQKNPTINFLYYPSCRDPEKRDNAAIFDIKLIAKKPHVENIIKFFYDNKIKRLTWVDYQFHIAWHEVS